MFKDVGNGGFCQFQFLAHLGYFVKERLVEQVGLGDDCILHFKCWDYLVVLFVDVSDLGPGV